MPSTPSLRQSALAALLLLAAACGDKVKDADGDGVDDAIDCDPEEPAIGGPQTWYGDSDGDGFAGEELTVEACEAPAGYDDEADDCDDLDDTVYPGAAEVCDGVDNDCDGLADDDDDALDPYSGQTYYQDDDGDGFGTEVSTLACEAPEGFADQDGDCDDTDAAIHPETVWSFDFDGDAYGDAAIQVTGCDQPDGYVLDATDCDDSDPELNPGMAELCDEVDNDCDGLIDDADDNLDPSSGTAYYEDLDEDGYGTDDSYVLACDEPEGYATEGGDCDDDEELVNPGQEEVCNDGLDNDCDGGPGDCAIRGTFGTSDADAHWGGVDSYEATGRGLASAGDVDGDGITDALVGAPSAAAFAGRVSLVLGDTAMGGETDLGVVATFGGDVAQDFLGHAVAGAGDLDGDGYDDLALGAYGADPLDSGEGLVYVILGDPGPWTGSEDVAIAADLIIAGSQSGEGLGVELSPAGDLDGDGFADLLMGADGYDADLANEGAVYLLYGAATLASDLDAQDLPRVVGESANDNLGEQHSTASGDLDGDGVSDLALGAYRRDVDSVGDLGTVYIFTGGGTFSGTTSAGDADTVIDGDSTGGDDMRFGQAVAVAGDMDADGYDDLGVGAYYADSTGDKAGAVYLFLGSAGSWGAATDATAADAVVEGDAAGDYLGYELAAGGDLDGDGYDELLIGAYSWDGGATDGGGAFAWFGDATLSGTLALADMGLTIEADHKDMLLGYSLAGADINGDGQDDLLAGALIDDDDAGGVYVFFGQGL